MGKAVQLLRRCKTDDGWKILPIAYAKNNRVRPDFAVYQGLEVKLPGHYVLRTTEAGKTKWTNVGNDAARALAARGHQENLYRATEAAEKAGVQIVPESQGRINLRVKKDAYLARLKARGKHRMIETSGYAIREFLDISMVTYADQVKEDTVLDWYTKLREQGNEDRTIYNKHVSVFGLFRWLKMDTKALAEHPPTYTERVVSIYSSGELGKLLLSLKREYLKVVFTTFHQTGLRERELVHLTWADVDLESRRIHVREHMTAKGKVGIKDGDERDVPISGELVTVLKNWKEANPHQGLVFPTKSGVPNNKLLTALKRAARAAGLNCKTCEGCIGKAKECRKWTLKRFRSTCTTTLLRNGLDVRTVMSVMGHKDLATTMKYLAIAEESSTLQKLDTIKWT